MMLSADERSTEPITLPAKYPNILINGNKGLGMGDSAMIMSYNLTEVFNVTIKLMKNPNTSFVLIPDSPTGCDIVEGNFAKITETGVGYVKMRCKYEIDSVNNIITVTAVPYRVNAKEVIYKIAEIKKQKGLPELLAINDYSNDSNGLKIEFHIRHDVNPQKFMIRLIESVPGLEQGYPVNVTVVDDFSEYDYSLRQLLLEWIQYRREQKRITVVHKRTRLVAEQRANDVKIFLLTKDNLNKTVELFRSAKNKKDIEEKLLETYRNSEIRMDSLQAKVLSEMSMHELTIESYEKCIKKRELLLEELKEIENILNTSTGIDDLIIGELKDGIKRFGSPRKSNVVPRKISINTEVNGYCILQLNSNGMIIRKSASNIDDEPIPTDVNGFAAKVDNDSSFVVVDNKGQYSFISVRELPVDQEVPLMRYIKGKLDDIIALLPYDYDDKRCCTLISKFGIIKKFKIADMKTSKKPCIELSENDYIVKGIVTKDVMTHKDFLVFTSQAYGQRFDPNDIRLTSYASKGMNGFHLNNDDYITGAYSIDGNNEFLIYVTSKGKVRKNRANFLPVRNSKKDDMVRLISLNERDSLLFVGGCNQNDKIQFIYNDGSDEIIDVKRINESTMSSLPEKIIKKNMVSSSVIKVRII